MHFATHPHRPQREHRAALVVNRNKKRRGRSLRSRISLSITSPFDPISVVGNRRHGARRWDGCWRRLKCCRRRTGQSTRVQTSNAWHSFNLPTIITAHYVRRAGTGAARPNDQCGHGQSVARDRANGEPEHPICVRRENSWSCTLM